MDEKDTAQKELSPLQNGQDQSHEEKPPVESASAMVQPKPTEEDDVANEADLSPPPESSSVSSVNPDMLGDEIVVGTRANGNKASPLRTASEPEDTSMTDVNDAERTPHYPKRKRASIYNDLGEDKMESPVGNDDPLAAAAANAAAAAARLQGKKGHGASASKSVLLGYWRDSPVPQEKGKHAVIGFMDVRDRLRTRIQSSDREGAPINTRLFPIPPGPGGSWVTFERIVFLDHLIGLDHNQVKEYVKVRTEGPADNNTETQVDADHAAVKEAKRRIEANPVPEPAQPPPIAWGREIPEHVQNNLPEAKRRRLGSSVGTIADRVPIVPQQQHLSPQPMLETLPGTRPTRILVGCWTKSEETEEKEKHAVYGILGANDMFRVKLVRETMDGRYLNSNFPIGAGALWIPYEEVQFLPHLADFSRPEMKEYVRVRQSQIDAGETEAERVANETKAVYEAQQRATALAKAPVQGNGAPRPSMGPDQDGSRNSPKPEPNFGGHELRHARREGLSRNDHPLRQSLPEAEIRQATGPPSIDPLERVQGYANREVARMEAAQMRTDRHQANRHAMAANPMNPHNTRRDFQENVERMQKIWIAQETNRLRADYEDSKLFMGVKYERKQNGPFAGKLVSQGTIISIDGEDYVEYRVLTKPSFF
ncbi:hypothetical protein F5B20DRAFT_584293 [Whalleya microplaca]|nr:hypothetical protein F5B20DRAFT_584293 [Whalleya microplaca]